MSVPAVLDILPAVAVTLTAEVENAPDMRALDPKETPVPAVIVMVP